MSNSNIPQRSTNVAKTSIKSVSQESVEQKAIDWAVEYLIENGEFTDKQRAIDVAKPMYRGISNRSDKYLYFQELVMEIFPKNE